MPLLIKLKVFGFFPKIGGPLVTGGLTGSISGQTARDKEELTDGIMNAYYFIP